MAEPEALTRAQSPASPLARMTLFDEMPGG